MTKNLGLSTSSQFAKKHLAYFDNKKICSETPRELNLQITPPTSYNKRGQYYSDLCKNSFSLLSVREFVIVLITSWRLPKRKLTRLCTQVACTSKVAIILTSQKSFERSRYSTIHYQVLDQKGIEDSQNFIPPSVGKYRYYKSCCNTNPGDVYRKMRSFRLHPPEKFFTPKQYWEKRFNLEITAFICAHTDWPLP